MEDIFFYLSTEKNVIYRNKYNLKIYYVLPKLYIKKLIFKIIFYL